MFITLLSFPGEKVGNTNFTPATIPYDPLVRYEYDPSFKTKFQLFRKKDKKSLEHLI